MNERTLLAHDQARARREHQAHRLDEQRPLAQVAPDDEAAQDGLDLGDAGAGGVGREHPDQQDAARAEQTRPERVEDVADEVLAKALVPVAERLGPREPLGTPCDFVEFIKLS